MEKWKPEAREFVREQLAWMADFLHKKYKLKYEDIRELIREMLSVSI